MDDFAALTTGRGSDRSGGKGRRGVRRGLVRGICGDLEGGRIATRGDRECHSDRYPSCSDGFGFAVFYGKAWW